MFRFLGGGVSGNYIFLWEFTGMMRLEKVEGSQWGTHKRGNSSHSLYTVELTFTQFYDLKYDSGKSESHPYL